eukprot:CAMPEP_0175047856 /NCGR_PEP_ID=MMETSP0052_2-20121109/5842_1 /TAXON_ID=51329 ORGANISM="Polytomella parva, Strain SAG 63-3" /NCGR_SAMPLE_ID=MMETSP0052_2 /ASSEMBLY_ACC=CAM_ASM_000194 /LENGTH=619 /DNA_ID=CAMNT_0016311807 /DNA_START=124 /DNA_END=1979 /DNA_ORIENTATION=-
MELELFRQDLLQTGAASAGCLVVLPLSEEKKTQKIAIGDVTGVVQCLSFKKNDLSISFKTLPTGQKVTSMAIGKGRNQRDRIFYVSDNQVKGVSRKGKEFFKFNTQLMESIQHIDVYEKSLWTSGEYGFNHFFDGKDKDFFLSPDRINAAEVLPIASPTDYWPVLACQDRFVRVLSGNAPVYEAPTASAPRTITFVADSHDPQHRFPTAKEVLYGTENGTVVQLLLESDLARQGFVLPNPKKLASVKAVFSDIDFTKTGMTNMVLGRDDGSLEIYDLEDGGQPIMVFSTKLSESLSTITGGFITSLAAPELLIHTFSGKVIGFAPPGAGILLAGSGGGVGSLLSSAGNGVGSGGIFGSNSNNNNSSGNISNSISNNPNAAGSGMLLASVETGVPEDDERARGYQKQIERMKAEIAELKHEVDEENIKFQLSGGNVSKLALAAPFSVEHRCRLVPEEACYLLSLQSSAPLFCVALQSNARLELLSIPSNVAIMSRSPEDPENDALTLATYRCQDLTNQLSIKFRLPEGGKGANIQLFVIPQAVPKTCVSLKATVRPLCLHQRISDPDMGRQVSEMVVKGDFSVADMHSWLYGLLPELPERLAPDVIAAAEAAAAAASSSS